MQWWTAEEDYFTRIIVILTDSNGVEGIGEVPGGEKITQALHDIEHLVVGTRIVDYKATMNHVRKWLDENIKGGVLAPQEELKAVQAIKAAFPDARVDLRQQEALPGAIGIREAKRRNP